MNPVVVRNLKIGEGIPKICVPIVGTAKDEILKEAEFVADLPADLVEWRADCFADVGDIDQVTDILAQLRDVLKERPLLFTFRTSREGGEQSVTPEAYVDLNRAAAQSGFVDLLDVEIFTGDQPVSEIVETARRAGVKVIASNHDFDRTPEREELIKRLCKMQSMDADILKIAVMPQSKKDVLTLLAATEEMYTQYADRPIVTMSMAGMGAISRLSGEFFGSAITFGAANKASAPGQMGVRELAAALRLLHDGCQ